MTGILRPKASGSRDRLFIRSARVAGLPRLEATAVCKKPPGATRGFRSPLYVERGRSEVYSRARLSPSILLYLFEGKAKSITLRQKPDTVQFDN
jgi:hypothetical protein